MWRSVNFALVLLCLFGRANGESVCGNQGSMDFREEAKILPVQFISHENGRLTANFTSKFFVRKIEFRLLPDFKDGLFETNGEWEEEISRKAFLKKFKKDYWLVVYKDQEGENILCEAHQFKNWESLRITYGQGSDNLLKTVDTLAYWWAMKMRPLTFYSVDGEKGQWLFLAPTDEPFPEVNEYVELENSIIATRILKTIDGSRLRLIDYGVFSIAKDCVFHVVETKNPKKVNLPMTETGITLGRLKSRVKSVDRDYFFKNSKTFIWLCFFDKETETLLRAVQVSDVPKENGSNNKSDKEPNIKNGKILK